jgi:hypothetical protein
MMAAPAHVGLRRWVSFRRASLETGAAISFVGFRWVRGRWTMGPPSASSRSTRARRSSSCRPSPALRSRHAPPLLRCLCTESLFCLSDSPNRAAPCSAAGERFRFSIQDTATRRHGATADTNPLPCERALVPGRWWMSSASTARRRARSADTRHSKGHLWASFCAAFLFCHTLERDDRIRVETIEIVSQE